MGRITDLRHIGRPRRRVAPLDSDTAEVARARRVDAGMVTPAHYDPASPHYGGRDLHESGKLHTPWDGSRHTEGSAIAASPLQAAVVPAESYLRQMRNTWSAFGGGKGRVIGRVEKWEAEVFRMMREGPGFVGTAASMYGEWMAGSGQLVMQERAGRDSEGRDEWVTSRYEPALEILRMWRGEDSTQADLIRDALTFLDSVGQFYQCLRKSDTTGEWVYDLWAHSAVTGNVESKRIEARGLPNAAADDPLWFREYVPQLVDHLFLGDREWRGQPTSQMQRVIRDIYRLILAERTMDRDLSSRLAMNGVLWIPATSGGKDWTADIADWASAAFSGTYDPDYMPGLSGTLEEVAPFPLQSAGEPKHIEIGRDVSKGLEVWRMAWNAICIGLDMPKNAMDGNEAANRWTGFLNRDEESVKAAAPRMQRLAAMVERTHFRPWARILGFARPVDDFRVWYELPDVRPERTSEKLDVARILVPTRRALAETVGWSSGDLADPPEGMTDYEAMFLMTHGKPLDLALAQTENTSQLAQWRRSRLPAAEDEEPVDELDPALEDDGGGDPLADGELGGPGELGPGVFELGEPEMPDLSGDPMAASLRPMHGELESWNELVPR